MSPAFDLAAAVEPLTFTAVPVIEGERTIPEPSEDTLTRFRRLMSEIMREGRLTAEAAAAMDPDNAEEEATKLRNRVTAAVIEFCGGALSTEEYEQLPYRWRLVFNGWLAGKFTNPTNSTAGTST